MSWLSPGNISPSEYDPQKKVEGFTLQYGEIGKAVLECFNKTDPLHVFFGDKADEYVGYAKRFMEKLGELNLKEMGQKQISELVRNSFHQDQIGKFVTEKDLDLLTDEIINVTAQAK